MPTPPTHVPGGQHPGREVILLRAAARGGQQHQGPAAAQQAPTPALRLLEAQAWTGWKTGGQMPEGWCRIKGTPMVYGFIACLIRHVY